MSNLVLFYLCLAVHTQDESTHYYLLKNIYENHLVAFSSEKALDLKLNSCSNMKIVETCQQAIRYEKLDNLEIPSILNFCNAETVEIVK